MFNEAILKVAKKVLDKRNVDQVQGNIHYNVEKNLLTITDTFILVEIWMPAKYKERFKDLEISDVTIDYYTACGLLAMLSGEWIWEFSTISLWNATVQDFIEYEYCDFLSSRNWIKVRLPIIEALKLPTYKEERLFNTDEDSTKNIPMTSSWEKFQEIVGILSDSSLPVIRVSDQTYISEWKIDYLKIEELPVRMCVARVKEAEV